MLASSVVTVDVGAELVAHVSGVHRCGSPWSCLVCAPVVRERRAAEIDTGLGGHLAAGGGAEFVTLTVPHRLGDELAGRLEVMCSALVRVLHGASWDRRRDRLGYVGAIRAVEVTWSAANGWHPHCHAVLLFDRPLSDAERADLRAWLLGRWQGVSDRHGWGALSKAHGVDVRQVATAGDLAGYLAKVDGGWGAALELARSDVKRSKAAGGMTPAQLLAEFVATGESCWLARWMEYERATFGKRAIVWSRGLRARLLGTDVEVTDQDAAASEGAGLTLLRALVAAAVWNRRIGEGTAADLLSEVEHAAAAILLLCDLAGVEAQPLDVPGGREAVAAGSSP